MVQIINTMNFNLEYWFRYNGDEKDFDTISIEADTLELAKEKVQKIRKWIFRIDEIK